MGRRRAAKRQPTGKASDATVVKQTAPAIEDISRLVNSIDDEVEKRIASMLSAAEDAITSLKHELKTKLLKLPKKIRQMPLKDFRANYPDDYKSGALEEIRLRYAKLAEEVAQQHRNFPAALQTGAARTARKRGIVPEPATVLHTVKSRRVEPAGRVGLRGDAEPQPRSEAEVEMKVEARTNCNSNEQVNHPTQRHMFNGLPLETPMPFAGAAVPIPMTMVTQRRGGRIPATALPDAVILETADGKKWAVGKDGLSSIPETHRAEVMELIKNQAQFWATLDTSAGHKAPPGRVVTRRR